MECGSVHYQEAAGSELIIYRPSPKFDRMLSPYTPFGELRALYDGDKKRPEAIERGAHIAHRSGVGGDDSWGARPHEGDIPCQPTASIA